MLFRSPHWRDGHCGKGRRWGWAQSGAKGGHAPAGHQQPHRAGNQPQFGVQQRGEKTSLTAKLQAALGYLQVGDTADAIAALQAFINEVNALVNSGRLTTADAEPLISAAEGIIAEL